MAASSLDWCLMCVLKAQRRNLLPFALASYVFYWSGHCFIKTNTVSKRKSQWHRKFLQGINVCNCSLLNGNQIIPGCITWLMSWLSARLHSLWRAESGRQTDARKWYKIDWFMTSTYKDSVNKILCTNIFSKMFFSLFIRILVLICSSLTWLCFGFTPGSP